MKIEGLSLEEKVGQLFMIGLEEKINEQLKILVQ